MGGVWIKLTLLVVAGFSAITTWTAPGDDGMVGRASHYELRAWHSPIDSTNWDSAFVLPWTPVPDTAGSQENCTVYFAIYAIDDVGNAGDVSNSPFVGWRIAYPCADVNGDGMGPDIGDLAWLVDWMFTGGPEPECE